MIVAPLAAAVVQMAISRTREYAADRRGAEICDHPLWLASALGKIARNVERIHNDDAERNPATAHLFIINPLSGERMDNLFSTHPNTENRIAALQAMEQEFAIAETGRAAHATGHRPPAPQQPAQPRAIRAVRMVRGARHERPADEPAEPVQKSNPWGRNPTGPKSAGKGRWS